MERTIINIDKGPIHIFCSLQESDDALNPVETKTTTIEQKDFERPETGWIYLALEIDSS